MAILLSKIMQNKKYTSKSLFISDDHRTKNIENVIKQVSKTADKSFISTIIESKNWEIFCGLSDSFSNIFNKYISNKAQYKKSFDNYLKSLNEAVEPKFDINIDDSKYIKKAISEVKKITSSEPRYDNLLEAIIDEEELEEQPAYAGSRVDYDKPSLDAIGSGEGHAAHGWGLYYTQSKDVATSYYRKFTFNNNEIEYNGQIFTYNIDDDYEERLYKSLMNIFQSDNKQQAKKEEIKQYDLYVRYNEHCKRNDEKTIIDKKILDFLYNVDVSKIKVKGQIHQVDLPEDEYLLDEQKPLKEQSEYVKNILYKILSQLDMTKQMSKENLDNLTGGDIYKSLCVEIGGSTTTGKKDASLFLYKNGIKGITYDGMIDGRCYVIFNPDDVKVIDKLIKENEELEEQPAYCGASKPFDKADPKLIGKGHNLFQHGFGFYFTTDKESADYYRRGHTLDGKTGGAIMTVELPEDKYFINEDNEEQSEYVYKRLVKLYNSKILSKEVVERNKKYNLDPISGTGREIYDDISDEVGGAKKASELLVKFGIKGITYFSRTDGKCFVIFSPDDIKVIEKQDFSKVDEQVAYHGSSVDHNGFSLEKVGSGNTGVSHGYGLYFTNNKKEAEHYKNTALKFTALYNGKEIEEKGSKYYVGGVDVDTLPESDDLWQLLSRVVHDGKNYTYNIKWQLKYSKERLESEELTKGDIEYYKNSIKSLKNQIKLAKNLSFDTGMIYRVEIPDDEFLIKEEEHLTNQSPTVWKAIYKMSEDGLISKKDLKEIGGKIYVALANKLVKGNIYDKKAYRLASEKMLEYGIKGIVANDTYKGKTTRVFCIFSEKDVKILNKNSEAKLLEMAGVDTIFYHGTQAKDIKNWYTDNIFWSTDKEFAETYGKYIYSAKLNLGKVFDILDKKDFDWLLNKCNGVISIPDENSDDDQDFEVCDYVNFMKWEDIEFDNWECVEQYLDIIKTEFNSCRIYEQGTENYVIFDNNQIQLLKDKPDIRNLYEAVSDFNINLQKAVELYIKFKLETYDCLEPDDALYITYGIQETHKDLIEKAMQETGASNEEELCWKINDCKNLGKYSKELVNAYALQIIKTEYSYIKTSFEESPYIYRAIASDKELNEFIKDLQEFGTGNCWADSIGYARQYYGEEGMKYTYILKGVVSDDNIDWIKTLALNAEDETEQEIRLLNNKPIKVIQIFEDKSNTDEYVDLDLNTGSKYGYDHYQKYDNLNESIYHATMLKNGDMFEVHQNPTKKEFWDLLNRSEVKDLRGVLGINEPILYVWDSYYGTHKQIFDSIIGKDWKEDDYVGCWFRKNDMGVFGFSKFTSDIKEKYYGKEPEKPMSKDKLDKIIADDDLGLLNEDYKYFDNRHEILINPSSSNEIKNFIRGSDIPFRVLYNKITDKIAIWSGYGPLHNEVASRYNFGDSKYRIMLFIVKGKLSLFEYPIDPELIGDILYYNKKNPKIYPSYEDYLKLAKSVDSNQFIKSLFPHCSIENDLITAKKEYDTNPEKYNQWYSNLTEEIAFAQSEGDTLKNIIYKNPTRQELKKDGARCWRIIEDDDGNWYYGDAYEYIHNDMVANIGDEDPDATFTSRDYTFGYDVMLYDCFNNTFILREDICENSVEERLKVLNDYLTNFKDILKSKVGNTFGNYKACVSNDELPWDNYKDAYFGEVQLTESIVSAESNYGELYIVIYKNPTRKELSEDKYQQFRIVEDVYGNLYFANAHDFVHIEIENRLEKANIGYYSGDDYGVGMDVLLYDNETNTFIYRTKLDDFKDETLEEVKEDYGHKIKVKLGNSFKNCKFCLSPLEEPWLDYSKAYFGQDLQQINEDLEGYNRIAGFYWFGDGHWEMLKRKPEGVEELDPEDDVMDYCHLDDQGLEEDNKARFGIQRMDNKIVCYIQAETKQKCLQAKKAIDKKFSDILIDKYEIEWYNPKTNRNEFEYLDEAYVQVDKPIGDTGMTYNADYIEFEVGMRFLDEYDVDWEVEQVKGDKVLLRSKNNQVQVFTQDDLNLDIDLEHYRIIFDPKFYTKSDVERATGQKFPEDIEITER